MNPFQRHVALVCAVIFLGALAHGTMLTARFKTLDDSASIIANEAIKDFANARDVFRSSFFGGKHYYRPMVSLSYMIEYRCFGLRSFYFNLDNLALHLMTAVTVFFLILYIAQSDAAAFFASLLFAVHPLQWEAVSNIPGRAVLLSTFFTVNALFYFIYFIRKEPAAGGKAGGKGAPRVYYVLSLACFACGLLSKESAAMLPVLLAAYILIVDRRREKFLPVLPYLAVVALYLTARRSLGIVETYPWRSPAEFTLGVLTFFRAVLTFLRLFILPFGLHFDRAQEMFTSFRDPELWGTLLAVAAAAGLILKYRRRIPATAAFFCAWFCIELFPVAQIVTTIGVCPGYISAAEHFLYMPAVGIFALTAMGGRALYRVTREKQYCSAFIFRLLTVTAVFILMMLTARQEQFAQTAPAMFRQTLAHNPRNTRILYSMGIELANLGKFREAEKYFRKTLEREPLRHSARVALGRSLHDQEKYVEALAVYQQAKDAGFTGPLLDKNLNAIYPLAIGEYRAWLDRDPANARLHYSIATVYSRSGQMGEAVAHYLQAVALNPEYKEAFFNLASSYQAQGRLKEAAVFFQRVITVGGEDALLDKYAQEQLGIIDRALKAGK